jgi:uncharacterized protein YjbI with pentapeptide repeats
MSWVSDVARHAILVSASCRAIGRGSLSLERAREAKTALVAGGIVANKAIVKWEACGVNGCTGVRPETAKGCLLHDQEHRNAALRGLVEDGNIDARGVELDPELLKLILESAPQEANRPVLQNAQFDRASFKGTATFRGVVFKGGAGFGAARFEQDADFRGARFDGSANFRKTQFTGHVEFRGAQFLRDGDHAGGANFGGAQFQGGAGFRGARFGGDASFHNAEFLGSAWFRMATFSGSAHFNIVQFHEGAMFDDARFKSVEFNAARIEQGLSFQGVLVTEGASFRRAELLATSRFGPVRAQQLDFEGAVFDSSVVIEAATAQLSCAEAHFKREAVLRLRYADVVADAATFDRLSSITLAPPPTAKPGTLRAVFEHIVDEEPLLQQGVPVRPRLLSLQRVDTSNLVLADLDLSRCQFRGAYNLDRLRIESSKPFAATPTLKAVQTGWAWPPVWWWTRRQALPEEHAWRATHEHRMIRRAGWESGKPGAALVGLWVTNPPHPVGRHNRLSRHIARAVQDRRRLRRRLTLARRIHVSDRERHREAIRERQGHAREIATLYRALRKGREDLKDEPGAADFYYGEMEMRRQAAPRISVERAVLTLYWLVSGYALRAWRAVTALGVVLLLAAWLFVHRHGFVDSDVTFWNALRYSSRTAIGLLPKNQPDLTPWGEVLQLSVRIIIPVLLGLAVLSLRGRVKR